ncbi:glutamate--cysteine ligase catalytic subunit isoform X1 [Gopherus flavomarginatus]|uniref:glutamate--cysteine ligase catalytic subunit isoform X1 n=2 Tax=Gopherus flavomarginatus TaxID=286002 RepID=UPI0021CBA0AF|nr:glutamate--cysteine ligase catalytic subunit isoform X1 [Gopherus flavomarginatus]
MGLLSQGSPLSWEETQRHAEHVRRHGILQFLHIYRAVAERHKDVLKWGDEVEYMLVAFDHEHKKVRLSLTGEEVLRTLQEKGERVNPKCLPPCLGVSRGILESTGESPLLLVFCPVPYEPEDAIAREVLFSCCIPGMEHAQHRWGLRRIHPTLWRPEYGSYMIEGTPGQPYGGTMSEFNTVQDNMRKRRQEAASVLKEDEALCTVTSFPRLGCPGFTLPECEPTPVEGGASKSLFFPDEAINKHPRFSTLTRNIRHRRGEKVVINVPIFKDKNTPSPFIETFPKDDGEAAKAAKPDHIYMDAMGFGMGNCCLQVTFQACSISEARCLYDQLATICPIVMALSAAAPFYRGYVSDIDCRWGVISASVDDRTREERGLEPLKNNHYRISKSRYDSIDSYLSECGEKYNDIDLTIDKEIYEHLVKEGIDHLLAQHIAHLFIRDPLTLFEEKIHLDDANESDHFENIQSTNWQTMRFKPPPPNSDIGWRVEFRPMEVQLTDFENSAYVVFVVLLTRVILSYKLDFLIPLSKVDENMKVAQKRDAVRQGMFYFRKDICKGGNAVVDGCGPARNGKETDAEEYTLMSIDTIINGKDGVFPGLIPILNSYLENMEVDVDTRCTILNYLKLIKKRASGELMTVARWMREFIANHPDYKQDSVITDEMNYSLIRKCNQIAQEQAECPELLGVGFKKIKHSENKTSSF